MAEAKRKKYKRRSSTVKMGLTPWTIFLIIIISTILLFAYVAIIGIFAYLAINGNGEGYFDVTKNFNVSVDNNSYYDSNKKEYVIEGVITNKTFREYDDVEIEYYLYDKNGVVISVARSFIEDIESKESVRFKATSDDDVSEVNNYKLVRIVEDSNYYNNESMNNDPLDYDD